MKVAVELTEKQADAWIEHWLDGGVKNPYNQAGYALRDAIVTARQPLKVGDTVLSSYGNEASVIALGRSSWGGCGVAEAGETITLFSEGRYNKDWTMADGSPIVWPK